MERVNVRRETESVRVRGSGVARREDRSAQEATNEHARRRAKARRLRAAGFTVSRIARELGRSESLVKRWLHKGPRDGKKCVSSGVAAPTAWIPSGTTNIRPPSVAAVSVVTGDVFIPVWPHCRRGL